MDSFKCPKIIRNPCIICLQSVKKKNGVQCKGGCSKWAHFACLNFTPGKIQDIKAGIVSVVCPCPGCETLGDPKETMTEPHLLCDHGPHPAHKIGKKMEWPNKDRLCPQNEQLPHKDPAFHPSKVSPIPTIPENSTHDTLQPNPPYLRDSPFPYNRAPSDPSSIPLYYQKPPLSPTYGLPVPCCHQVLEPSSQLQMVDAAPYPVSSQPASVPKAVSCSCFTSQEIHSKNPSGNAYELYEGDLIKTRLRHSDSTLLFNKQEDEHKVMTAIKQLCTTVGDLSNEINNLMAKMFVEPGGTHPK